MTKVDILAEYHSIVGVDSVKARSLIKKLAYQEDHYLLQCIAQTYLDESILENDGSMRTKLDERKWRLAEKYIIKAFTINPNCPDVLWVMGKVRKAYGQIDIAIYCFKKIIKLGIKGMVYGKCKMDISFANELLNDSKFELYRLYYYESPSLSKKYLSMYKKGLEKGANTIYMPLEKFLLD